MAKQTSDKHQLSGDWTITGVVNQVDSLSSSLEKLVSERKKRCDIDCGQIKTIDMSGLQLIHIWMECAKMHGVQAQLVNLPEGMQQAIQRLGLQRSFTDNYPDVA